MREIYTFVKTECPDIKIDLDQMKEYELLGESENVSVGVNAFGYAIKIEHPDKIRS